MLRMAGLFLENSLYVSAAIVVALLLGRLLRSKIAPGVRHTVWFVLAVLLMCPVRAVVTLPQIVPLPGLVQTGYTTLTEAFQDDDLEIPGLGRPYQIYETQRENLALANKVAMDAVQTEMGNQAMASEEAAISNQLDVAASTQPSFPWKGALLVLWATGMIGFLAIHMVRELRFKRSIRRCCHAVEETHPAYEVLGEVAVQVGARRTPVLMVCEALYTPLLVGLFRPTVYLPDVTEPEEALRLSLTHELLHDRRGDLWARAVMLLATAINWFNPIVYAMVRQMVDDAELACDEGVVRLIPDDARKTYGELLLRVARKGSLRLPAVSSAMSGTARSLRARLESVLNRNGRKRWLAVLCALVLITSVAATFTVGGDGRAQAARTLPESDALVVYVPEAYGHIMESAVALFREAYPEVEVTLEIIDEMSSNRQAYNDLVAAEMMAGEGPDLVFVNARYFRDMYKTIEAGAFVDLAAIMDNDPDVRWEDFNQPVMDAGMFGAHRYVVPFEFTLPYLVASTPLLESIGFDPVKMTDVKTLLTEIIRCGPAAKANLPLSLPFGMKLISYALLPATGIRLIDYEKNEVLPDEAALREYLTIYKQYRDTCEPADNEFYYYIDAEDVVTGQAWFAWGDGVGAHITLPGLAYTTNYLNYQGGYTLGHMSTDDGGLNALVTSALAIRAGSPNQQNAYRLLKLVLSDAVQKDFVNFTYGEPVRLKSSDSILRERLSTFDGRLTYSVGDTRHFLAPTLEEKRQIVGYDEQVTHASFGEYHLAAMLEECIQPYLQGESMSLDDCMVELRHKLTLHLSE